LEAGSSSLAFSKNLGEIEGPTHGIVDCPAMLLGTTVSSTAAFELSRRSIQPVDGALQVFQLLPGFAQLSLGRETLIVG
jgi:hypothetical protein